MITITDLSNAWAAIVPQVGQNIGRRADDSHPLDFFISYDENHNMQMILASDCLPIVPASSIQIAVRANPRHDGKYALCFSLSDESLKEQFVSLCWDMMDCTYNISNKANGVKKAIKRFCMWQKLFAEPKNKKMSDDEVKGLIGELCVLKQIVLPNYSEYIALSGWIGPLGADRDFEMSETWCEVKTVSLSKDTVSISSLDQLDINTDGELCIVRIEKSSPDTTGSFSLNMLIKEIRADLEDWDSCAIFDARIAAAKYSSSDPRSDDVYMLHQIEIYKIDQDFPRIRRSQLPIGIVNAKYELSIPGIQNWRKI